MSKNVLIVLGGLPASGKSTYAEMLVDSGQFCRVCPDLIRKELYGNESIQGNGKEVFKIAFDAIQRLGKQNFNVVFDATNIYANRRKELVEEMRPYFDIIIFKWFDVATAVCLERNRQRERQVPEEVIWRMAKTATVPTTEEGFDYVEVIINY
jgi:predicted kinase